MSRQNSLIQLLVLVTVIYNLNVICSGHYVQWEYQELPRRSSTKKITPSEIMVDITNDLSYRVLYFHSLSNRNNIAFSPTALTSVLIALYEGSTGRSSLELKQVLGLPVNRDVTRIGYRDIHRRLRTYFFEQDNPLVGLSLNKENVTITPEYEAILKFYGYDLGIDMVSSSPAPAPAPIPTNSQKTTPQPTTTTTTNQSIEETTITASTTPIIANKFNELETTTEIIERTTQLPITTTYTPQTTPDSLTGTMMSTTSSTPITTPTQTTASLSDSTETATGTESISTIVDVEDTTEQFTETTTTTETPETTTTTIQKLAEIRQVPGRQMPASENTMFPRSRRPIRHGNQMAPMPFTIMSGRAETRSRIKRHFFGDLAAANFQNDYFHSGAVYAHPNHPSTNTAEFDTSVYVTFLPAEPHPIVPPPPITTTTYNIYNDPKIDPNFAIDPSSYILPKETSRNNVINHIFYLSPQETIQTTYKTYNSILNYKYLEELKFSVLELELDSNDYNLVIFLPDFNVDMDTAIASLKVARTLRLLRKELKPRWVQAIIPDFEMKGNIFLTNDLQNMGVHDIFEPSRADFTPMSDDHGIYTKHIEQSINVHIRTRSVDQIKRNIATQHRPIEVGVNHPFLFFIVDKELDVALMAGKVLNPLNVRIQ